MKTFYLIDGHSQIFRAYYAPFGQLTSPTGEPTKAVYVFTQMLLAILDEKKPDYLAVTLDFGDETTHRRSIFPEYKAHRDVSPEDFSPQVDRIVEILSSMGIPVWQIPGYEADDIIASIAKRLEGEDIELRIVSRDKDLHQILTDRVKLWDPQSDRVLDASNLEAEVGYPPEKAVEIQTLTGDSTDNVPGIPGIGPKKAIALIQKYGTAENVVAHAHELTPKMRENVLASKDVLPLSRELVTLHRDVDVPFRLEECDVTRFERARIRPILETLGFRTLVERLDQTLRESGEAEARRAAAERVSNTEYHVVCTPEEFDRFFELLRAQSRFALDAETTSLRPVDCDLVGLSFSWRDGEGWYLPLRSNTGPCLDPATALERLRPILEDPQIEKYGQNLKFDRNAIRTTGVVLQGIRFDSMVASYLLRPDRRQHNLDTLAEELLGHQTMRITELIGTGKKQITLVDADYDKLAHYAAEDADIAWRLYETLAPRFKDEPELEKLFEEVEMPLVEVLADMEHRGITIDTEHLAVVSRLLTERIDELVEEIYRVAECEFSIDSPKQLAEVLFDRLGFRVVKKTKTARSTDASVLEALAAETVHPLPKLLLEYRELTKLRGTYVDPLPSLVSPRTGRLHGSFHQTVTATGRLSSSDPNLQNIPIRTEQGREIRKAFVATDADHVLITADYSQIELRVLAHMSRDPALVEAFQTGRDVHAVVAAELQGVPIDKVSPEWRSRAKAVNFGIIYGQSAFGLSRALGISRTEAAAFIEGYKARHPGIVRFIDECIRKAETDGFSTTLLGRKRPIPEIRSRNRGLRAQGERLAINSVVQGTAADMIKVAMVRIHRRIRESMPDLAILIQVHDELVCECPRTKAEDYAEIVRSEMASALPLDVPIEVDVGIGDNWLAGKS